MGIKLTVKMRGDPAKVDAPAEHELDAPIVTLGRDQSCTVVLAQQAVSRNHARISQDGQLFFVEDLGSAFGTQLNGKKLPKGEKRLLNNGDTIAIAAFDVVFQRIAAMPRAENGPEKTHYVAKALVREALGGVKKGEGPYIRVMNGPREGEKFELTEGQELIVGRDPSVDLAFEDDLMSRRHLKVRRDWSGTHVEDLGSRNGIKINRKKLLQKTLASRDELEVGGVKLLYVDPNELGDPPVDLEPSMPSAPVARAPRVAAVKAEAAPDEAPAPAVAAKPARAAAPRVAAVPKKSAAVAKRAEPEPEEEPAEDAPGDADSEQGENSLSVVPTEGDGDGDELSQFSDPGYGGVNPEWNPDGEGDWNPDYDFDDPYGEKKKPKKKTATDKVFEIAKVVFEKMPRVELPEMEMPKDAKGIGVVVMMVIFALIAVALIALMLIGI